MNAAFAPGLGPLVERFSGKRLEDLWLDPVELARAAIESAIRTGATHVLFPFDDLVLAEATSIAMGEGVHSDTGRGGQQLGEVEVDAVLSSGRVPAAIEAARHIRSSDASLAAHAVSPLVLVRQVAADPTDEDCVATASDIVSGFLRAMLEIGAPLIVVKTEQVDGVRTLSAVNRLAEHFGADVVHTVGDARVAVLAPSSIHSSVSAPLGPDVDVVITSEPLDFDVDLADVMSLARRLRQTTEVG
jgi:hypothetical protein